MAGHRKPQRIGAPAREVSFVAGDAIARTHHAAHERAAGAVVVAHLDGALEAAAGAGKCRPVELVVEFLAVIIRRIAEQAAVIELRRAHDLARIVKAVRVEAVNVVFLHPAEFFEVAGFEVGGGGVIVKVIGRHFGGTLQRREFDPKAVAREESHIGADDLHVFAQPAFSELRVEGGDGRFPFFEGDATGGVAVRFVQQIVVNDAGVVLRVTQVVHHVGDDAMPARVVLVHVILLEFVGGNVRTILLRGRMIPFAEDVIRLTVSVGIDQFDAGGDTDDIVRKILEVGRLDFVECLLQFFGLQSEQALFFLGEFELGVFAQVAVAAGEFNLFRVFRDLFFKDVLELVFPRLVAAFRSDTLFLFFRRGIVFA